VGFREFGIIVGRGKRAIEDHFTCDDDFIENLYDNNKNDLADTLQKFYDKICNSEIMFINQPKPIGFGDAVYKAKIFTGNESFLIHAGDDLVFSKNNDHLKRMINNFENRDADAVFLVNTVSDPTRYGVVVGEKIDENTFKVKKVFEKPKRPPSNLALIATYIFKPVIYEAIEKVEPDDKGEIQLTEAIQKILDWDLKVYAVKLKTLEKRIDIGSPETYIETFKYFLKEQKI
jgi:UTP--glucose-1-phosphate uridylyltransferase